MSIVFINIGFLPPFHKNKIIKHPGGLIQGFMTLHKCFETSNTKRNTLGQREVKTFADIIINVGIAFLLLFRSLVLIH